MNGNGLPALVALLEVIALEHARHRVLGGQLDQPGRIHGSEPSGIELDQRALAVQDLEYLLLIGQGVGGDFFRS